MANTISISISKSAGEGVEEDAGIGHLPCHSWKQGAPPPPPPPPPLPASYSGGSREEAQCKPGHGGGVRTKREYVSCNPFS